jgi:hypothetical protein
MGKTHLRSTSKLNLPELELHISTLEQKQYQVIRSFLQRRDAMHATHRRELASLLTRRLMKRWGISPSGDIPDESFLEEIVGIYERTRKAI